MKKLAILFLVPGLLVSCGGGEVAEYAEEAQAEEAALLVVEPPEPLEVPAAVEVTSETDWEAKAHNKEIEVIQIINILNPVAAYITVGFEQYGDSFSAVLHEEWADTQEQLTKALALYDSCKGRMAAGEYDKQLFLDLEEVWQLLVKTGVAGVRTKSMVDSELGRLKG
jgi:hypothetical protein